METMKDPLQKPLLIRHMGYSAITRTARADRSGHRKKRVSLESGRKLHANRNHQVVLKDFVANHEKLLEHVRVGTIQVYDPDTGAPVPYKNLLDMILSAGMTVAVDFAIAHKGVQQDPVALGKHEDANLRSSDEDEDEEEELEAPPEAPLETAPAADTASEAPAQTSAETSAEPVPEAPASEPVAEEKPKKKTGKKKPEGE